jgi:hypothetical protein
MVLQIENELVAADRGLGDLFLEGGFLRDVEETALRAGLGVRLVERQERRRRAGGRCQKRAPGRAELPRDLRRALMREPVGKDLRLAERHRFVFAVGAGVHLDRQA